MEQIAVKLLKGISQNDQWFLLYLCTYLLTLFTVILFHSIVTTYLPYLSLVHPIFYCLSVNPHQIKHLQFEPSLPHSKGSIECTTAFLPSHYVSNDRLTPFLPQHHEKHSRTHVLIYVAFENRQSVSEAGSARRVIRAAITTYHTHTHTHNKKVRFLTSTCTCIRIQHQSTRIWTSVQV